GWAATASTSSLWRSAVDMRLRRSSETATASASASSTPRPVFAETKRWPSQGAKWNSRAISRSTAAVVSAPRSTRSHLFTASTRPAEDGDAYVGRLRRRLLLLRQPRHDRVEQVAGAGALDRRDRVEVSEPERIELRGLRLAPPGVGLVRREHHRLTAAAEAVGDVV